MSAPAPITERLGCATCGAVFRMEHGYCPLDRTPLTPLENDPLIGATLADRYVIERCVGEGGMGRVYRARHRKLDRLFAVKVLYGDLAASPKMRSRFEREARTASKLEHPRLVPVLDFDITDSGLLYLAMSYIEGRELAAIIEEDGPLEPARIIRLLRQLCDGLGYAHDQGMVHRDFKGQNVLVSGKGASEQVHILDFGLAFMREGPESARLTTQGVVMGTPAYMAPEQAMNQTLDHRTDLFSLGVLLYEMLAGTLPFQGTPLEVARQNMVADPPPIARRVPGLVVDDALESIAFRLMEKLPRDRFQSAREVVAALDALATSGESTRSVPMRALSPYNAIDTAGITQDIQVVVGGHDLLGATHAMEQTSPLPVMTPTGAEAPGTAADAPAKARAEGDAATQARAEEGAAETVAPKAAPVIPLEAAPLVAPAKPDEPRDELVVTDRVRPRRSAARFAILGGIAAVLLALLVWRVNSGSDAPPAEPATRSVTPPGEPAAGTAVPETPEPADVAVPSLDEPAVMVPEPAPQAAAQPGAEPAAPTRGQTARPRPRPDGAASATTARAPRPAPQASAPSGQDDERLEAPPDETDGPDLVTLYERVGEKLAAFERARGRDAAAPLWAVYRTIPLADALRTPSLGEEAIRKLRKIERDLKRAP